MKEEINKNTEVSTEPDNTESDLTRREFLSKSTGTVAAASVLAAGSAVGLMGASSSANAAVAAPEPDSPDTSVRWKTPHGDLYNEQRGYSDKDVTGWKDRKSVV